MPILKKGEEVVTEDNPRHIGNAGQGAGANVNVTAINVFDKSPPVAQLNLGFDPIVHDPRGRVIYVGVNQKF